MIRQRRLRLSNTNQGCALVHQCGEGTHHHQDDISAENVLNATLNLSLEGPHREGSPLQGAPPIILLETIEVNTSLLISGSQTIPTPVIKKETITKSKKITHQIFRNIPESVDIQIHKNGATNRGTIFHSNSCTIFPLHQGNIPHLRRTRLFGHARRVQDRANQAAGADEDQNLSHEAQIDQEVPHPAVESTDL